MTTIKACCPYCGNLELTPMDLHLHTYDRGGRDFYEFLCPGCQQQICKPADEHIITALRLGRVPETRVFLPAEACDPKRDWTIPLTYDHLLDFVLELGVTDDLSSQQ